MSALNRPSASIVIPVFNGAKVIVEQISFIASQLNGDDELVIANNRSTDDTAEIVNSLKDKFPQVKLVDAQQRQGVNHARNTGIQNARHSYILLCDADDRIQPGWVDAMISALLTYDIVGGKTRLCRADGAVVTDYQLPVAFNHWEYALGGNLGVRRRVLEDVGGFDESFVGGHDEVDFAWRAQQAGFTLGYASEAIIEYVQRDTPREISRQYRNYGRTSIQLWCRYRDEIPLKQISLPKALLGFLATSASLLRSNARRSTLTGSREWGWALGVLEGHLRYRVFGRLPDRIIPSFGELT